MAGYYDEYDPDTRYLDNTFYEDYAPAPAAPPVPASQQTPPWAPTPSGQPTDYANYTGGGLLTLGTPQDQLTTTLRGGGGGEGAGQRGYSYNFGDVPRFNAPQFSHPEFRFDEKFKVPTAEDLYVDPSYQTRRDEGARAVEQSAAGRGTLRTGGTLKDILNYGQSFASREYGNVYDRNWSRYLNDYEQSADKYRTNYGVSRDVFDRQYQGARDEFAPLMLEYQTQAEAERQRAQLEYQRQFDELELGLRGD